MKTCPACHARYLDDSLEFCLEDGNRLTGMRSTAAAQTEKTLGQYPTERIAGGPPAVSEETVVLPSGTSPQTKAAEPAQAEPIHNLYRFEYVPIVLALLHNWWQWVYLEKVYVYSWLDYLLSANFLMWLLLFASGLGTGIFFAKRNGNKLPAIIALAALSINLILFLVPRR